LHCFYQGSFSRTSLFDEADAVCFGGIEERVTYACNDVFAVTELSPGPSSPLTRKESALLKCRNSNHKRAKRFHSKRS